MKIPSRILIIGSNGFIARNLINKFKNMDHYLIGISKGKFDKNRLDKYFSHDLTDVNGFKDIIDNLKVNYIFHLGGLVTSERSFQYFERMLRENFLTSLEIIKAFSGKNYFKKYFFFSSIEEYGNVKQFPISLATRPDPNSPYALAKNITTSLLKVTGENEGFPVMIIRPSFVFGKYMSKEKFIPAIIKSLKNNNPINLTECQQYRDFIHIEQFLNLFLKIIETNTSTYSEFNIASGIEIKLEEIALLLAAELNKPQHLLQFGMLPYRKNEIMRYEINIDKINYLTGISINKSDIISKIQTYIKSEYEFN